jgi:transcriptional regulator GlxA family with amidase domain
MYAHSDEPLAMRDIAKFLGVSLRSLQLAFAETHDGLTPRDVRKHPPKAAAVLY